ncbi:MAG: hypothetical protein IPL55_14230 [Saprospiraceae bacterium]|jgi:hypothetical protein|nr:hypothetical protein [Saprospiraceae bacterium]MBL0026191.1 hypothetical protein [Saprospiraceae bacterium]
MIPEIREKFNKAFTTEKYEGFKEGLRAMYNLKPNFREAETPFFIPSLLKDRLLEACEQITEIILRPDLKEISQGALYDETVIVPNEDTHTTFLQMDFGVCLDEAGDPFPMLIEIQGFPSVYFFQYMASKTYKKYYDLPENLTPYFNGYNDATFKDLLYNIIVGDTNPKNVIILEIEPELQNTYIDLLSTSVELGIAVVCVTKVIKEGKRLFYIDNSGQKQRIERIYNRVIFDELNQRKDLAMQFSFSDDLDVKWIGHPNWFFRISKYIMPFLKNKYVPETYFLKELNELPADLDNFVLKPLFSFAGAGVIIDVTREDIDAIEDKSNYILQRKVHYEPVLKSPNDPVKVEVRMLMIWPENDPKPHVAVNLVRLSKGKMIGVKYNKDKDWVGGSVGFYEG